MTGIKICGLSRMQDIDYANLAKPDYIGFIINFPKSHRNVDPSRAAELREKLDHGIRAAGVFVDQPLGEVADAAARIGLDVIQLHGHEDDRYIEEIRSLTGLPVWKAFKVRGEEDLRAAERSCADEVLLDNGYGTGESFDWTAVTDFARPFILAGGLTPENIPEAVHLLSPELVDISSGVETDRRKDCSKMIAAVNAVRQINEERVRNE